MRPGSTGECERHGGLVKDRLAKGLETEVVFTPDDLEDLLAATASLKNRGGNRGRFTPYQLVIGQNPRVPHELLSDDPADEVGMQELIPDNADPDSPAKALKHSMQIRDNARMLMETDTARERLRSAGRAQLHRDRSYHRGQWVCLAKGSAWRERSNWGSSSLGGCAGDSSLFKMVPPCGHRCEDDFGSARESRCGKRPTTSHWVPSS